jgi:putative transposase
MPNHFHLLLRQNGDIALNKVLRRVFISFTRTYNLLKNRQGPLFLPQFKVVEINSQEQLLHVSRYIHLNPYSSAIITDLKTISVCPLTSMPVYQQLKNDLCEPDIILANFENNPKKYLDFVLDNAEYQRKLEISKKSTAS